MGKIWETISAAPAEAWIGLIGVIFGSLLAIFTSLLTTRASRKQLKLQLEHSEKQQRHQRAKERLEELYSLVSKWETELFFSNMKVSLLIAGQMEMDEYLKSMEGVDKRIDFNRITMIAGIYGYTFQNTFDEVINAKDDLASIIGLWVHSGQSDPNNMIAAQFNTKKPRLDKAIDDFKAEIVKAAKEV